jgi:hypothetical protein
MTSDFLLLLPRTATVSSTQELTDGSFPKKLISNTCIYCPVVSENSQQVRERAPQHFLLETLGPILSHGLYCVPHSDTGTCI